MSRKTTRSLANSVYITTFRGAIGNVAFPICDLPLENSLVCDGFGDLVYARSSIGTYVDRVTKLLTTAPIDGARFESDGLLLESASTNYIPYSNQFSNNSWTRSSITPSVSNVLDPTGVNHGTLLTTAGNNSLQSLTYARTFTDSGVNAFSYSIFVHEGTGNTVDSFEVLIKNNGFTLPGGAKPQAVTTFNFDSEGYIDETDVTFDFNAGVTLVDYAVDHLSNGWSRISVTPKFVQTIESDDSLEFGLYPIPGSNESGRTIIVYGAQIERKWYSTSYINNATAGTVSRSADSLKLQNDRNLPHISFDHSLTLDVKLRGVNRSGWQRIFWVGPDDPDLEREHYRLIDWRYEENNGSGGFVIYPSSAVKHTLPSIINPKTKQRMGYRRSETVTDTFANGTIETTGHNEAYVEGNYDWIWLGSDPYENEHFDGNISNLRIYDKCLSNDEILMV